MRGTGETVEARKPAKSAPGLSGVLCKELGIDGDAILSAFEQRAKAARSDKGFIDILQLVSHNFADPHFIVGPFDRDDWAIILTSSDLFGVYDGTTFRIEDVRAGSDAMAKGVTSGVTVLRRA